MADLLNFPQDALAVPAADIRMLADLFTSLQTACSHAAAMLIERLDDHDGDPDLEDNGDKELTGDEADVAWLEWHPHQGDRPMSSGRHKCTADAYEDDEPDDHDEDDDPAGQMDEDGLNTGQHLIPQGPGCAISDPGCSGHDSNDDDA